MGQARTAAYYDDMFKNSDHYNRPAPQAAWYPLWQQVAECVPEGARVLDIGCGPGQFCEVVNDRAKDYLGLDFSPEAVHRARNRAPGARFEVVDLNEIDFADYPEFDTIVACEVLEHIEADVEFISKIPVGKLVILTVPNFDDPSHVRHFDSLAQVMERYQDLLNIRVSRKVDNWYLLAGYRKSPPTQ